MMLFGENFWGDRNFGFEVLFHNYKEGLLASKDLEDFLSTVCSVNEWASTNFKKLASVKTSSATATPSLGSYTPLSFMMKTYAEHMAMQYGEAAKRLQELSSRVHKYGDQQKERQKQVRATEGPTEQAAKSLRDLGINVQRLKDEYHRRTVEHEKTRRADPPPQLKDLEKLEIRVKKAGDEYRQGIERYNTLREDFEHKMIDSSKRLQEIEENHLDQMRTFIAEYFEMSRSAREVVEKVEKDSQSNIAELGKMKLLEMFVKMKTTGTEKPAPLVFEEANSAASVGLMHQDSQESSIKASAPTTASSLVPSFLRFGRKDKQKVDSSDEPRQSNATEVDSTINAANNVDEAPKAREPHPEPGFDLLGDFGGFHDWGSNDQQSSNNNRNTTAQKKIKKSSDDDDDSSFDSDSDDDFSAFRQITIKERSEVNNAASGGTEDISQIMKTMTLNLTEPIDTKRKKKHSIVPSPGDETSPPFPDEISSQRDATLVTPEDFNLSFDPLFGSRSRDLASQNTTRTPNSSSTNSLDILSLYSTPNKDSQTFGPPIAARQSVTPKPILPGSTDRFGPPPVPPPPVPERVGAPPPPPPPARTRLPDPKSSPEKVAAPPLQQAPNPQLLPNSVKLSSPPPLETPAPVGSIRRSEDSLASTASVSIIGSESISISEKTSSYNKDDIVSLPVIKPVTNALTLEAKPRASDAIVRPRLSDVKPRTSETVPQIRTEKSATNISPPSFLVTRQSLANEVIQTLSSPKDGASSSFPISVYFSEVIDGVSRGLESSQCCGLKIAGRLSITFSIEFARQLLMGTIHGEASESPAKTDNKAPHPLMFRISPTKGFQFHHHKQLLSQMPSPLADSVAYRFEMPALAEYLATKFEPGRSVTHFDIDILRYKLKSELCTNACPLAISYRWQQAFGSEAPAGKAVSMHVEIRHRGVSACPVLVKNPTVSLALNNLSSVVAKPPTSQFNRSTGQIAWNLPDLTPSSPDYLINADIRFSKKETARTFPPLNVNFSGEGYLFSGLRFDLVSIPYYRLTELQKRFKSGHYDGEPDV